MSKWQPMKSAPKTGERILLWVPNYEGSLRIGQYMRRQHYANGKLVADWERWTIDGILEFDDDEKKPNPTHWRPLLVGPEEEE
jgi:hypothetical protein